MRFTSILREQAAPFSRISQALRSLKSENPKSYDRRATHVTSGQLCDDILQLLEPGLPKPHTCDIIDLNPGPCLWSQKLHEFLKPRRHILVEPRRRIFAQFIDPLLESPDSAYRYASTIKKALDPLEQLLSEETYQFMIKTRETMPRGTYAVNHNLLMTANLSGMARKITGFTGSQAKQFLNDYYRAIFIPDDRIHRYGLVRLLAWIGEDARLAIMPTSVNSRTKQSVQLEATGVLTEVAGPSQFRNLHPHQRRWYDVDVEQQQQVRELQTRGVVPIIPASRYQPDPIPPFNSLTPKADKIRENKTLYPHNQVYIQRLLGLDDYLRENDSDWYTGYHSVDHIPGRETAQTKDRDLKVKRNEYRILLNQLRTQHNTYLKARDFIMEQRKISSEIRLRTNRGWISNRTGLAAEGRHEKPSAKLIHAYESMQEQLKLIKTDTRVMISKAIDDYHCYDTGTMAWNWRNHDPLLVQDQEFCPPKPLSLIDFKPNGYVPNKIDTVDKQICFDYVCTMLMTNPGQTVLQGIKRLVPAGWEQFIERVPVLKINAMGGSWNLEHVRIRTLSPFSFIDIALAFNEWPSRPEIGKLMGIYKGVFDEGPK